MGHGAFVGAPRPLGTLSNHLRGQGSGKRCGGRGASLECHDFLVSRTKEWNFTRKNMGEKNRTLGHRSPVAARTEGAMLKTESTNIHVEVASRNTANTAGSPSLEGRWRRTPRSTGTHAARHPLTRVRGETSPRPCSLVHIRYPWLPSRRRHEACRARWFKDAQSAFWPVGTSTAGLRLSFGHLASRLARPACRVPCMKRGGPRKPGLTLPGVPSFIPEFQLTMGIRKTEESR